ncbi:DUF5946 family protein [Euzebya sp.]|uniref:DUF5946 family protein n=1 Tax=Euzebya sp. TaxID=1971409 RepID=UPI003516984E
MGTCAECGAPDRDGLGCRGQWDELLALEFSDVRAGPVHFHTVVCYQLQHPAAFTLPTAAREGLRRALEDVVVHDVPISEICSRMGGAFDGAARVRGDDAPPPTLRRWSMTVADVGPPDPDVHADRVTAWARAVLADL